MYVYTHKQSPPKPPASSVEVEPGREHGTEAGLESWVTEPHRGCCLEVLLDDGQKLRVRRISVDASRFTIGRQSPLFPDAPNLSIEHVTISRLHAVLCHKGEDV